jgi:hypothetical protein
MASFAGAELHTGATRDQPADVQQWVKGHLTPTQGNWSSAKSGGCNSTRCRGESPSSVIGCTSVSRRFPFDLTSDHSFGL